MKAYTKSPTTTVGRARSVFRIVMSIDLPRNSWKEMRNPAGIPATLAMRVDQKLTVRDTQTIFRSSGSSDQRSNPAESMLSKRNSIVFGQ
jgi:hypothetical protein